MVAGANGAAIRLTGITKRFKDKLAVDNLEVKGALSSASRITSSSERLSFIGSTVTTWSIPMARTTSSNTICPVA